MNVAVYFRVQLLMTVSSHLIDGKGGLYGFEKQGHDDGLGPTGMDVTKSRSFAGTSQLPGQETTKNYLAHTFKWNRGQLMRRTASPTSEIISANAPEEPKTQDASGESHGPQMMDIASHLLTDYGVMGVSEEEDSAKWAADQMRNRTKGSKEVNGSLVDAVETKLPRNQSMNGNQSSVGTLQVSNSSSEIQATKDNTSDNHHQIKTRQNGNILKNSTLTVEREFDKSRRANESLNQNQSNIVELKVNRTGTEDIGDAGFVIDISTLRPNQSFYLKLPNGTSAVNVRNSNLTFSPNKEEEDMTQETSGLMENTELGNDGSLLDRNISSVAKWDESESMAGDPKSAKTTNTIATSSADDLRTNPTGSQPSYAVASDALNLQGESRELQNPTGGEKANLEVYDDENLAKALSDSSVSSIVFPDKRLNTDNYLLGGEGQKKSTLQGKQTSMKRHQKEERNAVRRYLKSKKFSTIRRHRHTFGSRSHVLAKKDKVSPVNPPELIGASKNDSISNTQLTFGNGVQSSKDILLHRTQSNNTAQISTKDRPTNYGAKDNQRNAPLIVDSAQKVENHQAPETALSYTASNLKTNESNTLPSADPSQSPHKYNHEFLNNGISQSGNHQEKVTTNVLIQDDSGRPVYQGAVDIFKVRSNFSFESKKLQHLIHMESRILNSTNEKNQVNPNDAFKASEKDQNNHETSLPEVYKVTEQNQITSKFPADAKLHKEESHPLEDIAGVAFSNSLTGNQGSRNYSRTSLQAVNDTLVRNSSSDEKQSQQDLENKLRQHDKQLSVVETPDHSRPVSEQNDYEPQQQTYLQYSLQQQQSDNLPQNIQYEIEHPDSGEARIQKPIYKDDQSNFKEDIFHIVLHNGKMITNPPEHMTLTISGPLPTGVEVPVNSDGSNPSFKNDAEEFQSDNNAQQLDQMVSEINSFDGNSGNSGFQKTTKSAPDNYSDGHVQSSQEKETEVDRQKMLNQTKLDDSGKSRPSENNPKNDLNKQGVDQPLDGSHIHEQRNIQNVMGNLSLNQTAQKVGRLTIDTESLDHKALPAGKQNSSNFKDKIFIGHENANIPPHEGPEVENQNETLLDQADERLNSNILVKATDRATASLSSMNGLASNDEIAAMEGPMVTGDGNPESHKMDCHVSPQPGTSSLTILTCRKKNFNSNTPQAFKSNVYDSQTDQSLSHFPRQTQGRIPRLDEALEVLNQDTKESLNKEMLMEGKNIQNMLDGFAYPSVSMYESSDVGTPLFDWLPRSHKRNAGEYFSRPPLRMNTKGKTLWDPVHQIMLPSVLLKNYWRHLRRHLHRLHRRPHPRRPLPPWSRSLHGRESGFWGFHVPPDSYEYGHFTPSLSPTLVWSHTGNSLQEVRERKSQTFHQENASKRTSLFNNFLKGDRDNCRPHAEGLHSHMGEWEYLGRVLCSCPSGVGEW